MGGQHGRHRDKLHVQVNRPQHQQGVAQIIQLGIVVLIKNLTTVTTTLYVPSVRRIHPTDGWTLC